MTVVMLKRTGIRIGNQHWSIANMVLLPGVGRGGAVKGVPSIIGVFEKDPTTSELDCPNFSSASSSPCISSDMVNLPCSLTHADPAGFHRPILIVCT